MNGFTTQNTCMHFRPGSDRVAITGHNYSRERLKNLTINSLTDVSRVCQRAVQSLLGRNIGAALSCV